MRKSAKIILTLFLASCFVSVFSPALKAEIDSYACYMPSSGLKAQPGKISLVDSAWEYSYEFKAFDKLPVELSLDSRYIGIKKDEAVGVTLPAHLTGLGAGIQATLPFFKFNKTYFRMKVAPAFYGDDWDAHSSSFRLPVQSFLIYQPDDRWTFVAGIAVYPDFEREVLPILGFIYKANDRLTFNLVPKGPNISYVFSPCLTLFVEGGFSSSEFEVSRDSLEGAVLRYNQNYLGTGMKFKLNKYVDVSLSAGGAFNRYLKYRDGLGKAGLKDNLYTQLRIEIAR
jgi:hypothetical protein